MNLTAEQFVCANCDADAPFPIEVGCDLFCSQACADDVERARLEVPSDAEAMEEIYGEGLR